MPIKTRLCLISDTHNNTPAPNTTGVSYRHPLPESTILIHAGDITRVSYRREHLQILHYLQTSCTAELKLIIPGNHDISLDEPYYTAPDGGGLIHRRGIFAGSPEFAAPDDDPLESPQAIRELYTCPEAKEAGIVYMEEGTREFELSNGAKFTVYASAYTPEFFRWAFSYPRDGEDRFNSMHAENPVPGFPGVDVMVTHGPPAGVLDKVVGRRGENVGCKFLMEAVRRARPRLHVFGHIHEGYGAGRVKWGDKQTGEGEGEFEEVRTDSEAVVRDRGAYVDVSADGGQELKFGEETLFVNASVVTVGYKPVNAPWVVDLDLPEAK